MNLTRIGSTYIADLMVALSSVCSNRVESFSVVTIIFGDSIHSKASFMASTSFGVKA